eukprot:gene4919-5162_t
MACSTLQLVKSHVGLVTYGMAFEASTPLFNRGFEQGSFTFNSGAISGTTADSFYDNTEWAEDQVEIQYFLDVQNPRSGNRAQCVTVSKGFAQTVQWVEKLLTNRRYSLSLWARVVSANDAVQVDLELRKMAKDYDLYGTVTQPIDVAAGWVQLVVPNVLLPANSSTTGSLATGFMFRTTGLGTVCFDDASLQEVISVREGQLLDNPDFEDGSYPFQSSDADISGSMSTGNWFDNSDWVPGVSLSQWVQLLVPAAVIPWDAGDGAAIDVFFMINTGGLGTVWLDTASMTAVKNLPSVSAKPPSATITRNYFGMNINYMSEWDDLEWPVVDFGFYRQWGGDVMWATVQPDGPESFNWVQMDKAFQQVKARNIRIMFTLGQTPTWASSQPDLRNVYGPGYGSVPRDIEDWKRFLRALLRRYGRWIHSVEVWNEPNMQGDEGFYNGTPQQLAVLALATQEVLREVKSSAMLVTPPMAGLAADAVAFLRSYLLECKKMSVVHTGVAWHSYNMYPELDLSQSMQIMRRVMADMGLPANLPIFNTEAGILDGDFKLLGNNHTFGAGFLARTYVVNWAAGVRSLYWFAYDAYTLEGLTQSTDFSNRRPEELNEAGMAYNNVKAWLTGARMTSLTRNKQGIWMASLLRGTRSKSWIVWNGDQRVSSRVLTVPSGVRSRQDLITGVTTSMSRVRQLPVTDVPLLLLA